MRKALPGIFATAIIQEPPDETEDNLLTVFGSTTYQPWLPAAGS
jgi:hypothetical protein